MGHTLLSPQTLPPASTANSRCSLKNKRQPRTSFGAIPRKGSASSPPAHLRCALGRRDGVNTKRNTHAGGIGSPARHPPDCLSSRTGASAWLGRRKGGKSQRPESRAPRPVPGGEDLPIPGLPLTRAARRKRRAPSGGGGPGGGHASRRPQAWSARRRTCRDGGAWGLAARPRSRPGLRDAGAAPGQRRPWGRPRPRREGPRLPLGPRVLGGAQA